MNFLVFFLLLLFHLPFLANAHESSLMQDCAKHELPACEKLGVLYMGQSEWEKAFVVGEALCEKEMGTGCMFAGSSLLARGKIKDAIGFFAKACDMFEPYGCRSLGRLYQKTGEQALANMFFKRSCFYGLKEICSEVKESTLTFSPSARLILDSMAVDCVDTKAEACAAHFRTIKACALPLIRLDCQLLAGQFSLYFRAKFLQAQAKVLLLSLYDTEKSFKEDPKFGTYTYDVGRVFKDSGALEAPRYIIGFMNACGKKYLRSRRTAINSRDLYPALYRHLGARITANVLSYFSKGKTGDCHDPKIGYEAYAVANLDPLNPKRLDVWKVDQDKSVEHVLDGLPLP